MLVKPGMAAVGKTIAEAGLLNQDAAKLLAGAATRRQL